MAGGRTVIRGQAGRQRRHWRWRTGAAAAMAGTAAYLTPAPRCAGDEVRRSPGEFHWRGVGGVRIDQASRGWGSVVAWPRWRGVTSVAGPPPACRCSRWWIACSCSKPYAVAPNGLPQATSAAKSGVGGAL